MNSYFGDYVDYNDYGMDQYPIIDDEASHGKYKRFKV